MRLAPVSDSEATLEEAVSAPERVMTGTHFHSVDEKGRIIVPAKLRAALGERFWLILTHGDNIGLFDEKTAMDVLRECELRVAENPGDELLEATMRRITRSAEPVAVETGWRVSVPEMLRYYAQLDKDVVTVGMLNHAELIDREKWEAAHEADEARLQELKAMQGTIMRAAASGTRKLIQQQAVRAAEAAPNDVTSAPIAEQPGVGVAGGSAALAPTGHGGGSRRISSLSRVGR